MAAGYPCRDRLAPLGVAGAMVFSTLIWGGDLRARIRRSPLQAGAADGLTQERPSLLVDRAKAEGHEGK